MVYIHLLLTSSLLPSPLPFPSLLPLYSNNLMGFGSGTTKVVVLPSKKHPYIRLSRSQSPLLSSHPFSSLSLSLLIPSHLFSSLLFSSLLFSSLLTTGTVGKWEGEEPGRRRARDHGQPPPRGPHRTRRVWKRGREEERGGEKVREGERRWERGEGEGREGGRRRERGEEGGGGDDKVGINLEIQECISEVPEDGRRDGVLHHPLGPCNHLAVGVLTSSCIL